MVSVVCRVFLACYCLVLASAAPIPWASNFESPQQACGDKLADIMSVVCTGGYNSLFRTEQSTTRRFRRQIVDECCRRSCSPSMLKLYCLADPTEPPTNVQIRKRSDSEVDSSSQHNLQTEDITKTTQENFDDELSNKQNSIFRTSQVDKKETTTMKPISFGKLKDDNKVINLLEPMKHSRTNRIRNNVNESTQNETTEEEDVLKQISPPLRHHKNHHRARQLRGRKASAKTKKDKMTSASSESAQTPTFLIGTVKPYFADRVPVSSSSKTNIIHT